MADAERGGPLFRFLGPVMVVDGGGSTVHLGGPKARALLARLVVSANLVVATEQLIEDVWDGAPPPRARAALHVYLSQLRRALGEDRIGTEAGGYRLRVETDELDILCFESMVADARQKLEKGSAHEASAGFAQALELWRGPALADLAELEFARNESTRLEQLRLSATEDRVETDLACGRHQQVVDELENLTGQYPFRERFWVQRMTALYRCGRQVDSLRAYQEVRAKLADQLGIEPGHLLRNLEAMVLAQDPSLDWVQPDMSEGTPAGTGTAGTGHDRIPLPSGLIRFQNEEFVGRTPELSRLSDRWLEALTGQRQVVFVAGDAGIGKTRLVTAFATGAHAAGATVLFGRCNEEAMAPFEPFVEALRHYVASCPAGLLQRQTGPVAGELTLLTPELGARLPPGHLPPIGGTEGARNRLFDAVETLLCRISQSTPLVLILDDVHWADAGTIMLLRHIFRHAEPASFLVLATYREFELSPRHPLAQGLAEFRRARVGERVRLAGLSGPEVVALLSAEAGYELDAAGEGFADILWRQTEGNPFFIEEVIQHLAEAGVIYQSGGKWTSELDFNEVGIPEGIKDVIGRRIEHISPEAAQALTLAAVVGHQFRAEVVEAMADMDGDTVLAALEEAAGAGLIAEVPRSLDRYMFTHTLIRETLYSSLSLIRRVRTHRRLGEALEQLYAADVTPHLGELAHHFLRAAEGGDLDKALDYVIGAAKDAQAKLAYEEAAELVGQGLELLQAAGAEAAGSARRSELLLILGDAQRRVGEAAAAKATFLAAAEAARSFDQPDVLGQAALGFGLGAGGLVRASRADHEIIGLLEEALAAAGEQPSALRVRLTARLAEELYFTQSPKRWALGDEAVAMAEQVGGDVDRLAALYAREFSRVGPDTPPRERLEASAGVVELAYQLGDGELAYQTHLLREMAALEAGDVATADAELEGAERLIDDLKIASLRAWVTAARSRRAWLAGEFADADRLNAEALNEGADPDIAMLVIGGQSMAQQILRGDLNEYVPLLKEFSLLYPEHPLLLCFSAYACANLGRFSEAKEEFDRFAATGFDLPRDEAWLDAMWALSRCCGVLGDVERAEELYEMTLPSRDRWLADRAFVSLGPVSTLLGILAATTGRTEDGAEHFEQAIAQASAFPSPPWLADAQAEYAFMLLRSKKARETEMGGELARAALQAARTLGMSNLAARILAVQPG